MLADVGMPERNGYEVAAFIKGNPALAHIPVVLLTGAFEPVDEVRARAVGCDGVLVKPFEPQIVISRVKDLLAGRQPSGMWSAGPVAQGPVRQASGGLSRRGRPQAVRRAIRSRPISITWTRLSTAGPPAAGDAARRRRCPRRAARRFRLAHSRGAATAGGALATIRLRTGIRIWWGIPRARRRSSRGAPTRPCVAATGRADAARPAAAPAPVAAPPAAAVRRRAPAPPRARRQPPSLVDAFAALLAAEQRIGLAPSAATTATPPRAAAPSPASRPTT